VAARVNPAYAPARASADCDTPAQASAAAAASAAPAGLSAFVTPPCGEKTEKPGPEGGSNR